MSRRFLGFLLCTAMAAFPACRGTQSVSSGADASAPPVDPPSGEVAEDGTTADFASLEGADLPPLDPSVLPDELPEALAVDEWNDEWGGGDPADTPVLPGPAGWWSSGSMAIQRAQAEEKPLVFWLSNTAAGPLDGLLGNEILLAPSMERRLKERAVGLRVDYGGETVRRSGYYKALSQRFRPKGYPTVLVLLPDGTEIKRFTGYQKGSQVAWQQRLDEALNRADTAWKQRKEALEKAGFRIWTDRGGGRFFAKAMQRDASRAVLVDPFRRAHSIPLERFSHESLADLLDTLPEGPAQKH